jgi:hypothetical protein
MHLAGRLRRRAVADSLGRWLDDVFPLGEATRMKIAVFCCVLLGIFPRSKRVVRHVRSGLLLAARLVFELAFRTWLDLEKRGKTEGQTIKGY